MKENFSNNGLIMKLNGPIPVKPRNNCHNGGDLIVNQLKAGIHFQFRQGNLPET